MCTTNVTPRQYIKGVRMPSSLEKAWMADSPRALYSDKYFYSSDLNIIFVALPFKNEHVPNNLIFHKAMNYLTP